MISHFLNFTWEATALSKAYSALMARCFTSLCNSYSVTATYVGRDKLRRKLMSPE